MCGSAGHPAGPDAEKLRKRAFYTDLCRNLKIWKNIKKVLAKVVGIIYNLFLQAAKKACLKYRAIAKR